MQLRGAGHACMPCAAQCALACRRFHARLISFARFSHFLEKHVRRKDAGGVVDDLVSVREGLGRREDLKRRSAFFLERVTFSI